MKGRKERFIAVGKELLVWHWGHKSCPQTYQFESRGIIVRLHNSGKCDLAGVPYVFVSNGLRVAPSKHEVITFAPAV